MRRESSSVTADQMLSIAGRQNCTPESFSEAMRLQTTEESPLRLSPQLTESS